MQQIHYNTTVMCLLTLKKILSVKVYNKKIADIYQQITFFDNLIVFNGTWINFNGFHGFDIKGLLFCFSGLSCGDVTWSALQAQLEWYATKYGLIFI